MLGLLLRVDDPKSRTAELFTVFGTAHASACMEIQHQRELLALLRLWLEQNKRNLLFSIILKDEATEERLLADWLEGRLVAADFCGATGKNNETRDRKREDS